jgi:hypothetical protein
VKRKHPKYTHGYIDQHDKPRFYLRRPGHKKIPLPGLPWSPEFMEAREAALRGDWGTAEIGAKRTIAGTVNAALVSYYQASAFKDGLAQSSQNMRRNILERFREEHGDKPIDRLHKKALQAILNKKSPAAASNWRKALRGFIDHAMALDMLTVDPLAGVKLASVKSDGHHPWEPEECSQFEARHPIGTRARLAYELLLQIGQSRCEVVRLGRQHVRNGTLSQKRQKTNVAFDVPVMPALQVAIDAMPASDHLTFLITSHGKAIHRGRVRQLVPPSVRRGRSAKAVHFARPTEGGRNPPGGPRRNDDAAHGVVRLENRQRGRALHSRCRSQACGRGCRQAHFRNRKWLTQGPGEPKRRTTH